MQRTDIKNISNIFYTRVQVSSVIINLNKTCINNKEVRRAYLTILFIIRSRLLCCCLDAGQRRQEFYWNGSLLLKEQLSKFNTSFFPKRLCLFLGLLPITYTMIQRIIIITTTTMKTLRGHSTLSIGGKPTESNNFDFFFILLVKTLQPSNFFLTRTFDSLIPSEPQQKY